MTPPPVATEPRAPGRQKGFALDLNLCTGCGACAVACAVENSLEWGTSWRFIETFNPAHRPGLPDYHLSLACKHCADAPCMAHCPALAYRKDAATGAVLLDPERCIGCRYCTWACPFDAPRFDAREGVVGKCTLCHHRLMEGAAPACVSQCPTGALAFGEVDALGGVPEVPGFPRTDHRPSVRFEPLRPGATTPSMAPGPGGVPVPAPAPPGKTSLATEFPLVVFTLLLALLAGLMATAQGRGQLSLVAFLILSGVAGAASTLHLGRRARAWRAFLNLRRSWLSREVALFTLFVGTGTAALATGGGGAWGDVAGVSGLLLLFAVDRVYDVTRTPGSVVHSGGALVTGVMVAGLAAASPWVWGTAAAAKAFARLLRVARGPGSPARVRAGVALAGLALAVGALLWGAGEAVPRWLQLSALVLLAGSEVLDRCSFYLELDVPTPRREMARALA